MGTTILVCLGQTITIWDVHMAGSRMVVVGSTELDLNDRGFIGDRADYNDPSAT